MTTVFHKINISREKLNDIIRKNPGSLIEGMVFIDVQLDTDECGIIDFLGVDGSGRLVLVDFEAGANDEMFISALSQLHWLKKNSSLIKRLFFSENIDFLTDPQMLLVSSGFSGKLISAVKQIKLQDIKLVEFKYITAQGNEAILFEEVFTSKQPIQAVAAPVVEQEKIDVEGKNLLNDKMPEKGPEKLDTQPVKTPQLILEDVSLSQEEIAEFMEFEKTLKEKKTLA